MHLNNWNNDRVCDWRLILPINVHVGLWYETRNIVLLACIMLSFATKWVACAISIEDFTKCLSSIYVARDSRKNWATHFLTDLIKTERVVTRAARVTVTSAHIHNLVTITDSAYR